jgi:hypothetical protein
MDAHVFKKTPTLRALHSCQLNVVTGRRRSWLAWVQVRARG